MAVAGRPDMQLDPEEEEYEEIEEEEEYEEEVEEEEEEPAPEAAPVAAPDASTLAAAAAASAEETVVKTEDKSAPGSEPAAEAKLTWPGWPGYSVFRLVIPVQKVGSVIGRKGENIKKIGEESRAKIRVLDAALGSSDQIVLISAKEELDAEVSPAMDGALRVFKRISDIPEKDDAAVPAGTVCFVRLLVPSTQAIHIIGKHGSTVKSIQENSGTTVRILQRDALPAYATEDERIIEIQGEALRVYDALKSITGHLRKFLVDHGVIPLFEKRPTAAPQESAQQGGITSSHLASERLLSARENPLDSKIASSRLILYGRDPAVPGAYPPTIGRSADGYVTQVTQTMQLPFPMAEEIIGVGGANISYVRRTSGAVISLSESRAQPDEIVVEIKGNVNQVQTAQQLIQDILSADKETSVPGYGSMEPATASRYGSYYSNPASSTYSSLYLREPQQYGGPGAAYEAPYSREQPYGGYRGYGL